jgi:serine/threonine-protein phosphatase 2A regulatory subunit B'
LAWFIAFDVAVFNASWCVLGLRYEKSEGHWNATVLGLAQNVLKMYHDSDMATYQDCQANYLARKEAKLRLEQERKRKWAALEAKSKAL